MENQKASWFVAKSSPRPKWSLCAIYKVLSTHRMTIPFPRSLLTTYIPILVSFLEQWENDNLSQNQFVFYFTFTWGRFLFCLSNWAAWASPSQQIYLMQSAGGRNEVGKVTFLLAINSWKNFIDWTPASCQGSQLTPHWNINFTVIFKVRNLKWYA